MSKWVKWVLGGLVLAGVGCSSDSDNEGSRGPYAMAIIKFGTTPADQATYITQLESLSVSGVDPAKGREFGGQANIAVYDNHLFVSSGDKPIITRFALNEDGTLREEGTISFANFGVPSVSVDATVNTFINPNKAYIFGDDGTQVIWNPTTMQLLGTIATPNLQRDGYFGVSTSSGVARGNRLYRVLYWADLIKYQYSDEQFFAVYDTDTDKLISMVPETRCPTLGALAFTDEGGTAYFSNWFYNVSNVLKENKPKSCMLRLPPNSDTLDPNWAPTFASLNGGHEGAQLSYAGGGKAIFATFHEEELDIPNTELPKIATSAHWESWMLDLGTNTATPIPGIDRLGAQQSIFHLDTRTFLLAPNQAFSESKVYEINADSTSRFLYTIAGWSRAFLKIK